MILDDEDETDAPPPDDEDELSPEPEGDDDEAEADEGDAEESEGDPEAEAKARPEDRKRDKRKRDRNRNQKRWSNLTRRLHEQAAEIERLRKIAAQPPEQQIPVLDQRLELLEAKRADLRRRKKEAMEQGDTDAELAIDDELEEVGFDLRSTRIVRDGRKASAEAQPPAAQPAQNPATAPSRLHEWAGKVRFAEWSAHERNIAVGVDQALVDEGYDRNDDDFYEELAERVAAAIPSRRALIQATQPQTQPARKPQKPVVTRPSVPSTASDGAASRTSVRLSPALLREMEKINLDPNSADDRAFYAKALRNHGRI